MASNDGPRYKMHPSRMQQLEEEAVAPKKTNQQHFGAHLFQKAAAENLQNTKSDKAKPPKKPSVHFTYTQGKRKKHLLSGKFQYHVVARKGKRKDRRKA